MYPAYSFNNLFLGAINYLNDKSEFGG